ncbi:hypothetical protein B7463_g12470, partial [Scytalidium lignicola]
MAIWQRVDRVIRTKQSVFQQGGDKHERAWGNEDLDPTPVKQRTWKHWNYFAFFWAVSFNPNQWNTGSSLVNQGLLWWQATVSIIVGNIICSIVLVFASRGPSVYHVGYPAYVRAAAGMYGSYFFIFLRGAVAIIYFGQQTYYAGQLTSVMIRCMAGDHWVNIHNALPKSAGISTRDLAAFFIFWIIQLPFMAIHPQRAKWLYAIKSLLAPPVLLASFAFVVGKNGGLGTTVAITKAAKTGSALGWAFMAGINSVAGSISPEITSNADLARYARRPSDTTWPQAVGIVLSKSLVIFLGIGASSASKTLWGTAYWNLWDLYGAILTNYWNAGARAAIFLACLVQILAVVATNLASNSLPVGADLTGLFPKYFNIRRGQIACAFLCLVTVPWKVLASAQTFLTFLGSYVCFIAPLIAFMICDYFFARKGNLHVPSLYNGTPSSPYWYWHGFNLRAFAAWAIGVAFVIHGLSGSYNISSSAASKHMYTLGFLLSFTISGLFYYIFCLIWPVQVYPSHKAGASTKFEHMAATDGYFDDDSILGVEQRSDVEDFVNVKVPEKI